ncbi:MAG: diguanylate cyclase [Leptospirales bacterium]|nr:diguanylate cyclase [Leptospirales bacterium]
MRKSEESDAPRIIYVVESDPALRQAIASELSYYGYVSAGYPDLYAVRHAVRVRPPMAIVASVGSQSEDIGMVMSEVQTESSRAFPVVFLAEEDSLQLRLMAARFGGVAFLPSPPDFNELVATLDRLATSEDQPQYRILIVENDAAARTKYAAILSAAGMQVQAVASPAEALQAIAEFDPELLLLNMYYDECLGGELAQVIRQHQQYVSLPIVFLSGEENRERQLSAMGRGGDDVLLQPIQPAHLVSSVTARVMRSHSVRQLMVRDSLTGLLNHTALQQRLDFELARAAREGGSLCFAMTDLDKFKRVNDTYGHSAGDQVIKNLARALKLQLRSSDVVGRHGGEEFGIILPGVDRNLARQALERVQQSFARIVHRYGAAQFQCSFSCGAAFYPGHEDARGLVDGADQALYAAKGAGGNVTMFDAPGA